MREKIKTNLKKFSWLYPLVLNMYRKISVVISGANNVFFRILGHLLIRLPIKPNKIVFCNYYGKDYGDNGKYIAEEMIRQNKDYDIVWLLSKDVYRKSNLPSSIRAVKYGSVKACFEMATSKIWVDNCRKFFHPPKRREQFYLNTGHGGIPLKKVEKDAEDTISSIYVLKAKKDSTMVDLMTSSAKFRSELLRNSYWYKGEVIECGSPKIEILMLDNNHIVENVKKHYKLDAETQILLYAPTFRNSHSFEFYDVDFVRLKRLLENQFGGRWKILFRLHPNLSDKLNEISDKESFIDATFYPDMQELLIASDILITDYSGTMFEYIYKDKPVFLYAKDINSYDRGFYFDFSDLPFPLAINNEELEKIITNFNYEEYCRKVNEFKLKVGLVEEFGASKKVVAIIDQVIQGNETR